MSRKEERLRQEGISYCLRFLKDHTVDELREDAKRRGIYEIPVGISQGDLKDLERRVTQNVLDIVLIMSLSVLRDEFDFGRKRQDRFKLRFNLKTECLNDGLVTWEDMRDALKDESGIDISIRWNGPDPTEKKEKEEA